MTTDDLPNPRRSARNSDPHTSHDAASDAAKMAATHRVRALITLRQHPDGLTDFELGDLLNCQQTSIGKRRGELRDAGLVVDSGRRRPAPSGSLAIVWQAVTSGAPMTDSIPLDELPPPTDPARRDQWGRYLVVPPEGGKPVGYTRVTTIAKALDDGGALASWKAAMTAAGIIRRRGLRTAWEALIARTDDPWYHDADSKREAKRLVEECATIGGANDRRDTGSALHALTALIDQGKTPQHLTPETQLMLDAYQRGLQEHGIIIVPGQIEVQIVLDSPRVAGTFDRQAIVPGFELPLIADLKTGSNLAFSWNSIAVQLAAYSRADAIYVQGAAKDGSLDTRAQMPPVNQDWGLVMALDAVPIGPPKLEFFLIDLHAGWDAFEQSLRAREWRKQTPARALTDMTPLPTPEDGNVIPQLEASVAVSEARKRTRARHPANGSTGTDGQGDESIADYQSTDRQAVRDWLQRRIDAIGNDPHARTSLVNCWPDNCPSLRASDDHTYEQLAIIEGLCDDIERVHSLGFVTARPGTVTRDEAIGNVVRIFPDTTDTTNTNNEEHS